MGKDYQQLWKAVTDATSKAEAVPALAKIVVDKDGRAFILGLEREAAELCIEILDYVSCDLRLPSFVASDGLVRASQSTYSTPPRGLPSSSR